MRSFFIIPVALALMAIAVFWSQPVVDTQTGTSSGMVVLGALCEKDEDCTYITNSPYPEPSCLNPQELGEKEWQTDDTVPCRCIVFGGENPTPLDGTRICQKS